MKQAFLLAVLTLLLPIYHAPAQVRQVPLTEMISSSGTIFAGRVLEVEGKKDARGDIVTVTTFRVETPIRGVLPGTVTITQYGGVSEEGSMVLAHMRYFTEGERVLVLLYPESELGFTSPIGMGQGVWTVNERDEVVGLADYLFTDIGGLMRQQKIVRTSDGRMPLASMVELIRTLTLGGGSK